MACWGPLLDPDCLNDTHRSLRELDLLSVLEPLSTHGSCGLIHSFWTCLYVRRLNAKSPPTHAFYQICNSALNALVLINFLRVWLIVYFSSPVDLSCQFLSFLVHQAVISYCVLPSVASHTLLPEATTCSLPPCCSGAIGKKKKKTGPSPRPSGGSEAQGWLIAGFHHRLSERGIVQEAFPSHWDPCGLRIPGFCCNNNAPHSQRKIQH